MNATGVRVPLKPAGIGRKRLDRSVRRAEKRRGGGGLLRVHGPIRPVPGAFPTTGELRGEKSLINWPDQTILS